VADLVTEYKFSDIVAQSLEPCCHMIEHLFEITDAQHMIVPMINTRDALIDDLLRDIAGEDDPFIPEIISAAESMGERYCYDAVHARKVADLALHLFDDLSQLHGLPQRCRVLLEVAALLHDVGYFISSKAHHKHSYYLVLNTELPGISSYEQRLIATAVRYHRRSLPKTSHLEYTSLAPDARVTVSKLAAFLRLADALDRAHVSKIRSLRVTFGEDRILLNAVGPEDLTLESWAVEHKADMFREVLGVDVVLSGAGITR
jgi:exopolyphosphatase/guanosine-5'-triphosphate,3'-diphosphate pyrophosphatase